MEKSKSDKNKINIDDLPNYKTTSATIRHALIRKGIYLPNHNKRKTSLHYMKKIINLQKPFLLTKDVIFVDVPHYEELKPENVIETCKLKSDNKIWPQILSYCPELKEKKYPKDRTFFFNVLNTIKHGFVDNMVLNAIESR